MADDKAPWRDPNKWAKFCEMTCELSTTAMRQPYSRWPADELSVAMNTLADLLEANAKFLREVAGIKREVVSDDEQ